ncbi:terpene synthase family protein (plasmid) [Streptomyces sp. BI20]|uniref:terpene synthase family protein n=1 Tax=Streptomyces sp. BI20 TaxID=3403460 RepID=UPI003C75F364
MNRPRSPRSGGSRTTGGPDDASRAGAVPRPRAPRTPPGRPGAGGHPSRLGPTLPPFWCPLPLDRVHPDLDLLRARAVTWLDAVGLYPNETERAWGLATHGAEFSCRIAPDGDPERLLLFIEWNHWANAVDDWQDSGAADAAVGPVVEHAALLARTLEAPTSGVLPPGPLTDALGDLIGRTRAALAPVEYRRVVEGARDWLIGAGWRAALAARGAGMPDPNTFAALGPLANGTRFSVAWIDAAEHRLPDPALLASPAYTALTEAAGFVVSADNDLFSYDKDDHVRPWEVNLVNVLAADLSCPPAEAVPHAVALRDRVMGLFLDLRARLATGLDPEGAPARHLRGLGHYVAGSIVWQNAAPRYASPRNRFAMPVPGARFDVRVLTHEPEPVSGPAPLPALASWWEQWERPELPEPSAPAPR